jgi:uncharacterized FlgJ-related protein
MKTNFYKVYSILLFLFLLKIEYNGEFKYSETLNIPKSINIQDTIPTLTKHNLECVVYEVFKDSTGKVDSNASKYAIKQIYLESGHLKSFLCLENNNLIGMKHPRVRQTTSLGKKNGYAHYEDWVDCVKDIYLWYKVNNCLWVTENQLLDTLAKRFAQDRRYKPKLVTIETLRDDRTDM